MIQVKLPCADGLDMNTLLYFFDWIIGGTQYTGQARQKWPDLRAQQATGIEVGQQVLQVNKA